MSNFKYQILNIFTPKIGNWRRFEKASPFSGKLKIGNSRVKRERGFTLIELLLYMGIFSTLLMVLVQLFGTIVNVNLESQATASVSQDGRYILNEMAYTIRQANTIVAPSGYGSGNGSSQLQFTTAGGKTYTYSLSSNNLMLSDGISSEQLNSYGTSVSNLSFTRLKTSGTTGDNTITISFTLTSTIRDQKGYQQKDFQTTIGKRF